MTILDEIIAHKKKEVAQLRREVQVESLLKSPNFKRTPLSLKAQLQQGNNSGIIAEFKRKSPSKGVINDTVTIKKITEGYLEAGAIAQSILTDLHFFGGTVLDLIEARTVNNTNPILRKDFIIDAFQIIEAKAIGADVILLIASCLSKEQISDFSKLATDIGLEVLYEVHTEEELEKIPLKNTLVGINNRNLNTFEVDWEHSIQLSEAIPNDCIKISESGISNPKTIVALKTFGFKGFLIGETFMKTPNPEITCKDFINQIISNET